MGPAGFGDTISSKSTAEEGPGWLMAYGIISTIGSIAAGILNQNDYARFARKPKDAILGQIFAFPLYAITCSVIGILVTAATQDRFGGAIWNPPTIFSTLIANGGARERAAGFFAGAALVVSQIGVNVPGNALSGGFDLAATFPKYINIRRGAYLTALLSVACNPWRLVNTATVFISVLASYSVFLGPMTGLMISSYFVVHKQKINVDDLFVGGRGSVYWYTWGVNWRAAVAVSINIAKQARVFANLTQWICGVAPSMPGFIASVNQSVTVPIGLIHMYYICFLVGFSITASVFCLLHFVFPAKQVVNFVASSLSAKILIADYQDRWDGENGDVAEDAKNNSHVMDREVNFS